MARDRFPRLHNEKAKTRRKPGLSLATICEIADQCRGCEPAEKNEKVGHSSMTSISSSVYSYTVMFVLLRW